MKQRSVDKMEGEAACQVSLFLERELGLSPCGVEAEMRRGSLVIRLGQAMTPMALLIARTEGGNQIVQGAYEVLLESCRERLHAQVAQIVGLPVCRSWVEVDTATEDVVVQFDLNLCLSPSETDAP